MNENIRHTGGRKDEFQEIDQRQKHALVLFTKYPEPGITKTRLIDENGGALSAEEAADLYRAMVMDTTDASLQAMRLCEKEKSSGDAFDFFISSSPAGEIKRVQEIFSAEFPSEKLNYVVDQGTNFDEHFNDCFSQLFEMGYNAVVCIGGDLPGITPDILFRAFGHLFSLEKLSQHGAMVLAPCQAAGVSLVGVTRSAAMDFTGVFYNEDGISALDAIIQIAKIKNIPTTLLEALFDVDYMEDLGHIISVATAMEYISQFQTEIVTPKRTLETIRKIGLAITTPPNTAHDPRSKQDD